MSRTPQNDKPPCGCVKTQFGLKEPAATEESKTQPAATSKSCGICKPESVRTPTKSELIPAKRSNVSFDESDGEPGPIKSTSKAQSSKPSVAGSRLIKEEELDEPEAIKSATRAQSRSRSKPKVDDSKLIGENDSNIGSIGPEPVKSTSRSSKSSKPKVAGSTVLDEDVDEYEEPGPMKSATSAKSRSGSKANTGESIVIEEYSDEPEIIKSATRAQSRSRSKPSAAGSTVIGEDVDEYEEPEQIMSATKAQSRSRSKPSAAGSTVIGEDVDEYGEPEQIKSATTAQSRSRSKPNAADSTAVVDNVDESEEPQIIKSAMKAQSRSRSKARAAESAVIEDVEESEEAERIQSASRAKSRSRSKPTVAESGEAVDELTKSRSKAKPSSDYVPITQSVQIVSDPEILEEAQARGTKSCECSTKSEKSQPTIQQPKPTKQKRKYCECATADNAMNINPNLANMSRDILYHLALGRHSHDLEAMFGDVKFVCMGSKPKSMEKVAKYLLEETEYKLPTGAHLADISVLSYRYSVYKIGPILAVSHGMGCPSIGILLNEMIKLLYYANVEDPMFFKMGKCQGIGVEPGTVIITEAAVDGMMNNYYEIKILGKSVQRPTTLDAKLVQKFISLTEENDEFQLISGKTMCADDFYEGQANMNGAFCEYTEEERLAYLNNLRSNGVVNMDMESLAFAALTNCAGIRAAIVTVSIIDRLKGDVVTVSQEELDDLFTRPEIIITRYIKSNGRIKSAPVVKQSVLKVPSDTELKVVYQASENFQT